MAIDWARVTVLVGRPAATAERWLAAIGELGARVVHQPGLVLAAADPQEPTLAAAELIGPADAAVFSSSAAVDHGLALPPLRRWLESGGLCWAVGRQTGARLLAAGARRVRTPGAGSGVDGLLAEAEFPAAEQVFLVAARGGRRRLARALAERGIGCHWIYAYQRRRATLDPAALAAVNQAPGPVAVLGTSLAIVEQLADLFGETLRGSVLISVSERITQAAAGLGFARIVTVPDASLACVLQGLRVALEPRPAP